MTSFYSPYYPPFGSSLPNRTWSDGNRGYRFGFNKQEKDNEISGDGNSYTAEFWQYDGRLGRRFNLDPISKVWQSQYLCFSGNPIINIDLKGNADFYNQEGEKVGTDGEKDGKIYIIINENDIKKAKRSYYGKGIKGFINKILDKGEQGTIKTSDFTGDFVSLPSSIVRQNIINAVDRSNKPTIDDISGGFHEEGGIFGFDKDGNETVVNAKSGAYADPSSSVTAEVDLLTPADKKETGKIVNVEGVFHIHPSGEVSKNYVNELGEEETKIYSFDKPPSEWDVSNIAKAGNKNKYGVVVAASENKVYIYGDSSKNQNGKTYRASISYDIFKKL
jgi:hypothetical protein